MDINNTPQTAVKVASLTHSLGKPIICAESYGGLEGGFAARSKMNQTAISHNWTSKCSEQNGETLELWGFYFMSKFQLKTPLSSPVNWENRRYSVTYAGRFICDFGVARKTSTSATHQVAGSESEIVLNWPRYSRVGDWVSVTQRSTRWLWNDWVTVSEWMMNHERFHLSPQWIVTAGCPVSK